MKDDAQLSCLVNFGTEHQTDANKNLEMIKRIQFRFNS